MRRRSLLALVLAAVIFSLPLQARAQDAQPTGPVYIVQSGDSLWSIAERFGVTVNDLVNANHLADANAIKTGDALVIPGLEGVTGRLETRQVAFGENLLSLSRRYQVPEDLLTHLNHLTSPAEIYAGKDLIIPVPQENSPELAQRAALDKGQSLLELSILQGVNPWQVVGWNHLAGEWAALPDDVLHLPGDGTGPGALPTAVSSLVIDSLPFVQGRFSLLRVQTTSNMQLSGSLLGHSLNFFSLPEGGYVALQGVHALTQPGIYPLTLHGELDGGAGFGITQYVEVDSGNYAVDPDLEVDPATIDPAVTQPEDAQWTALAQPATPDRLWEGVFSAPVAKDFASCWPSQFGNRRSYNAGAFKGFHTGLDYCGSVGNPIYAPAAGVVVFAGPLTVRGNATMINHGWGVYTGYMHQSEIQVQVGQRVEAGQQIGLVGNTGRVTGPHLHFEVWVGGVQVNPRMWLETPYP